MQPIVSELLLEAYGLTMIKILLTGCGVMAVRHVRVFFFFKIIDYLPDESAYKLFSFYYFLGVFLLFFLI